MDKKVKIFIAGHKGMVGSAIERVYRKNGYNNLILVEKKELDLMNQSQVIYFFENSTPDIVIIAAAKVGGIKANNTLRAEFIYNNLMIELNIINSSYKYKVKKLLFLGSSCIYPKLSQQPIKEEYILTDKLEPTNEPYSIAKIAGIKLCENFFKQYGCNFYSLMPTNLYGINDNFNLEDSHVIPALIRKFHEAKVNNLKEVVIWGSGKPTREFLCVDDLAEAILFCMVTLNAEELYNMGISQLNIGTGEEVSISNLAKIVKKIVGYNGEIIFDNSKPDGMARRLVDVTKIHKLGWYHQIKLEEGLKKTYQWFLNNLKDIRK